MAAKLIKVMRQRMGVTLSWRLLRELSSRSRDTNCAGPAYGAEVAVDACPATRQVSAAAGQAAYPPVTLSEPATPLEFRVYSSFGDTVTAAPSLGSVVAGGYSPMSTEGDKPDDRSIDLAEVAGLLADPVRRRSWLLAKALASHPLDQALELARSAEAFITGSSGATTSRPLLDQFAPEAQAREDAKRVSRPVALTLAPEQREQLLERLAQGARNAELARDFGLSTRQVQGIRMGSAREIARRRDRGKV
jgi:DNA-binding CsgD family transcriptional regulator